MITIENAMIYSLKDNVGMAYQIDYSDGTSVRSIISKDSIIRIEYKTNAGWVKSGRPYKVANDKRRQAERIVEKVKAFINA